MEDEDLTKQKKVLGEWAARFIKTEKETAFAQGKLHTYIKETAKENKQTLAKELRDAVLSSPTNKPVKPLLDGWKSFLEAGDVLPESTTFFTKVKNFFRRLF